MRMDSGYCEDLVLFMLHSVRVVNLEIGEVKNHRKLTCESTITEYCAIIFKEKSLFISRRKKLLKSIRKFQFLSDFVTFYIQTNNFCAMHCI